MSEEKIETRYWHVYISIPPPEGKNDRWRSNKTLGVVAPDMQTAAEIVAKQYPGATFWSITHRGAVHHSVVEVKHGEWHGYDRMADVKY